MKVQNAPVRTHGGDKKMDKYYRPDFTNFRIRTPYMADRLLWEATALKELPASQDVAFYLAKAANDRRFLNLPLKL